MVNKDAYIMWACQTYNKMSRHTETFPRKSESK